MENFKFLSGCSFYPGSRDAPTDSNSHSGESALTVNPLCPCVMNSSRIAKISILKQAGIIKIIFYERRDNESVDEKSLSYAMSRKTAKQTQGVKS